MSEIVKKVLGSGLIDKHTAALMEQFGLLEPGASDLVNEGALKDATKVQMAKLAEEFAVVVEREHKIKETYLDLERIRWPATVYIELEGMEVPIPRKSPFIECVMDRHGRYFFRYQDVDGSWFAPGRRLWRKTHDSFVGETIVEATPLYIDDKPVAIQVTAQAV
jgi:hypothetical protein